MERRSERISISSWTLTEFACALSRKVRSDVVTVDQQHIIGAAFRELAEQSFDRVIVAEEYFAEAERLASLSRIGLRAGDALHLAIVAANGLSIWTLDRQLAEAGNALGIKAHLV